MNELLKVNADNERITLSARDLYEFIELEERFSKWFERMISYGFENGVDFNPYQKVQVQIEGNREVTREIQDYQITIEMAKEIAMLQRNEKGKQARQYFMELEKAWNSPERVMARALEIANKTINNLQIEMEEMKPKAKYFDALVDRNLLTNLRDTAKELKVRQSDLINYLIQKKYLYRDQKNKLKPYSNYVQKGLFELKEFVSNGFSSNQVLVTPKGRETLRLLLKVSD